MSLRKKRSARKGRRTNRNTSAYFFVVHKGRQGLKMGEHVLVEQGKEEKRYDMGKKEGMRKKGSLQS